MLHSGSAASAQSTLRAGLLEMFGAGERWNGPGQREGKNNPFPIGFGRVGTEIKSTANTKEKSQKKGKKAKVVWLFLVFWKTVWGTTHMAFQNAFVFPASAGGQDVALLHCHSPRVTPKDTAGPKAAPRLVSGGDIPGTPQKRKISVQNSAQHRGTEGLTRKPNKQIQPPFTLETSLFADPTERSPLCFGEWLFGNCLLKVIIKEINHPNQPKPHQGLVNQLHMAPMVGPTASTARPRTRPRVLRCTPAADSWATLRLEDRPNWAGFIELTRPRGLLSAGQKAAPSRAQAQGAQRAQPLGKAARCHGENENKPVTTTRAKKINCKAPNTSPSCKNKGTAMTKQEHKGAA